MIKHPLSHTPYESIEFTALDRAIDAQRDAFKESISEAHKLGFETGRNEQLEQVIAFLRKNLDEGYIDDGDRLAPGIDAESVIDDLKQAMRPTQEDNT